MMFASAKRRNENRTIAGLTPDLDLDSWGHIFHGWGLIFYA
jgi:hypothetical protein